MDIRQLKYFIKIVELDFNMSVAAENLFVSQSTLSVAITKFEERERVVLFERSAGRLLGLTDEGEEFYHAAVNIVKQHEEMMDSLRTGSSKTKGTIRIGIPPFVLSVVFSEIVPKLIRENPDIKFEIREVGAYQLEKELLLGEIDIAILLSPTQISPDLVDSYEVFQSELTCFMSPKHEFADQDIIHWNDLHQKDLAIADKTFMINHILKNKFQRHNVQPNLVLVSQSWDFLISSVILNPETLVILPHPIVDVYQFENLIEKRMSSPIPWKVIMARMKKENHSNLQTHVLEEIISFFSNVAPHQHIKREAICS